jgi:hypothetical protein
MGAWLSTGREFPAIPNRCPQQFNEIAALRQEDLGQRVGGKRRVASHLHYLSCLLRKHNALAKIETDLV